MHSFKGKWIIPQEFAGLDVIDVFHKELASSDAIEKHPAQLRNFRYYVKGRFDYSPKSGKVFIDITADDYFKLYINGNFVIQGPTPAYYFDYSYNKAEITDYLHEGENEIVVDILYQGLINRVWNSGDLRTGCVFDVYSDNGEVLKCSDETLVYSNSSFSPSWKKVGYDTQYMEDIDLREENRLKAITKPVCVSEPDYTFSDEPARAVDVYEADPVYTEILPNCCIFCDFGTEITASLYVKADSADGGYVELFCGEECDDGEMKTRWKMRAYCTYDEKITFGKGIGEYTQYDYKAFRFCTVKAVDCKVLSFKAVVRHQKFDDEHLCIESNDCRVTDIFNLCKNTIKYGTQENFMDCPSREKGQYAGDMTITSASHLWLTGDNYMLKKAIIAQMESGVVCKGIMAVTPGSLMQEIADYSLQFPILALREYEFDADRDFLAKCYKTCCDIVDYFSAFAREDGLIEGVDKWNLVDWPENLRDGYDFDLQRIIGGGVHNVINAFYVGCVKQTEQIADILGIEREKKSERLTAAFNRVFFNEETGLYVDREGGEHSAFQSNVIPAFYSLQDEKYNDSIAAFVMKKGLCCGVYVAYFALKALCRMGHYEDAYELMTNSTEHSWLNMLFEGATTTFEAWGVDQKDNTSLCHPWATAPVSVIMEDFLGYRFDGSRAEQHLPSGIRIEVRIK